jgi:threonine dehydratase
VSTPEAIREPRFDDVLEAARRLAGHARLTPLVAAVDLSERLHATVLVKAENLQIGGAFKFRGAFNRLVQLDAAQRSRGVVAWSSGNHAQGIAAAGKRLGVLTTIVMPQDAPRIKIEQTQRLGAQIVFYDRQNENREAIGKRLAQDSGATLVPPYDDPDIIAGQGTVALEMDAQARAAADPLDILLVPCGGGGLISGCALAMSGVSPATRLYSVEPDEFDDTRRSLVLDERQSVRAGAKSLCDALMAPTPGELTFPINRRLLSGGLAVSDDMVLAAMNYAWRELKLVVEPGGAVALAAALHGLIECRNKTVGLILSGGNADSDVYCRALSRGELPRST